MQYIVIDTEMLKELLPTEWEFCRKSNDGKKAIIHKEVYDALVPPVMTLNLQMDESGQETPQERQYPSPLYSGDEINAMAEFMSKEDTL